MSSLEIQCMILKHDQQVKIKQWILNIWQS